MAFGASGLTGALAMLIVLGGQATLAGAQTVPGKPPATVAKSANASGAAAPTPPGDRPAVAGASAGDKAPLRPAGPRPSGRTVLPDRSPYIVVDMEAGSVLAARQADQAWYPASLAKLMTAYVTFRAMSAARIRRDTPVVASALAAGQNPVKIGFGAGARMTLDHALKMMLVPSANDAALVVAEAVGGSVEAFAARMNEEARRLGLRATHFENPSGLPDPRSVSTARDLAILARQIWMEYPDQRSLFAIQSIQTGEALLASSNLTLLQRLPGASGMKTGFTCAAGYSVVATATRAGRTLLVVALGRLSPTDRSEFAAQLIEAGFQTPAPADEDRGNLLAYRDAATEPGPVDLRVCSGGVVFDSIGSVAGAGSALGPPIKIEAPVRVAAEGGQKPKPKTEAPVAVAISEATEPPAPIRPPPTRVEILMQPLTSD